MNTTPLNQAHNMRPGTLSGGGATICTTDVVIEIPRGSRVKTEVCKDTGIYRADRLVKYPYPAAYGFIPSTLATDGDALDVFVLTNEQLPTGTTIQVDIVDAIYMRDLDDDGISLQDHKVIGVIRGEECRRDRRQGLVDFLRTYKEGTEVETARFYPQDVAHLIHDCREAYDHKVLSHPMHGIG